MLRFHTLASASEFARTAEGPVSVEYGIGASLPGWDLAYWLTYDERWSEAEGQTVPCPILRAR